jgi:hypothetical protein
MAKDMRKLADNSKGKAKNVTKAGRELKWGKIGKRSM